jgi:leucine dehydrogenase
VFVADIDAEKVKQIVEQFGVTVETPDTIHTLDVDIFCPCALGGIINDQTIPEFRCQIIAGSANNQLQEEHHGEKLQERGILYAPDYIINAGGTIYDTDRLLPGGFNEERAMDKVQRIYETMTALIRMTKEEKISTAKAADVLAERRIAQVRHAKMLAASGEGRTT